ncbi:MAG TPA: CBS domain-containing protein [Longimicrobiales bacterium]
MRAREIMTSDPAYVTADDSVATAARLMGERDCGCIPVVRSREDSSVIGVITDRDIAVRGVAHGRGTDVHVSELMTPGPFCCHADDDIHAVEDTMATHQVRRVVVVDEGDRCIGMIAQADLARAAERTRDVSEHELAEVVERISEPSREWRV